MADRSDEEMREEVILTPGETTSNSNSYFALTDAVKLLAFFINTIGVGTGGGGGTY